MDDFDAADPGRLQPFAQLGGQLVAGQGNDLGAPSYALGERHFHVAAGGQRGDGKSLRIRLNDGEGAGSDGTGRTEDADVLQRKLTRWIYC